MKKILVAAAALVWATLANAGEYHRLTDLKCSQCHAMHASRQHGLRNGTVDSNYPLTAQGTGYAKLLIMDGVNATCLQCHDNSHYPDVFGQDEQAGNAGLRSAGALNGTVAGHSLGVAANTLGGVYADWMGHTLGSTAQPPGFVGTFNAGTEGFNCSNCHAVHGSAGYRNLGFTQYAGSTDWMGSTSNPFNGVGPTYAIGTNDGTKDVFEAVAADVQTTNVSFGVGSGNGAGKENGMNRYCAACHGNFHGSANTVTGSDFKRHPTSGVSRAALPTVSTPLGESYAQLDVVRPALNGAGGFEPACLTCHKGHGNARGFGLIYPSHMSATVTDFENGDSGTIDQGTSREYYPIRALCITCHPQGQH